MLVSRTLNARYEDLSRKGYGKPHEELRDRVFLLPDFGGIAEEQIVIIS